MGRGSDDSLFALIDGRVKFERLGRDRKKGQRLSHRAVTSAETQKTWVPGKLVCPGFSVSGWMFWTEGEKQMFVDVADIQIKAGNGGDGAVSFRREKYVAAGGPDGGDGGRGGNIVFQADDNLSTLADFRYQRKYAAQNGENGRGNRCYGKSAPDLVIRVPKGTLVREKETGRILPIFH